MVRCPKALSRLSLSVWGADGVSCGAASLFVCSVRFVAAGQPRLPPSTTIQLHKSTEPNEQLAAHKSTHPLHTEKRQSREWPSTTDQLCWRMNFRGASLDQVPDLLRRRPASSSTLSGRVRARQVDVLEQRSVDREEALDLLDRSGSKTIGRIRNGRTRDHRGSRRKPRPRYSGDSAAIRRGFRVSDRIVTQIMRFGSSMSANC